MWVEARLTFSREQCIREALNYYQVKGKVNRSKIGSTSPSCAKLPEQFPECQFLDFTDSVTRTKSVCRRIFVSHDI